MMTRLRTFLGDDSGATAIEYGLIAGLVAIGALLAITAFGGGLSGMFNAVASKSENAMSGG